VSLKVDQELYQQLIDTLKQEEESEEEISIEIIQE
jgi:hypothetical protein